MQSSFRPPWHSSPRASARTRLQDQFKELIDRQQFAKIEKAEGKIVRWHVHNTMMLAKKAVDLMPDSPNRGADFKQFDAALAARENTGQHRQRPCRTA